MSDSSLALLQGDTASELVGSARLTTPALELLNPEQTPAEYLALLLERERFKDAYSFLAVALPPREAAWWAALCIRQTHGPIAKLNEAAALRAAIEWLLEPTSATRQQALKTGKALGKNSAAGCLALAVGQLPAALAAGSAGSSTAPEAANRTTRLLRRAVLLASVQGDPRLHARYPQHFAELGVGVASGEYTWKKLLVPAGRSRHS
jgi:hypothetical protein